MYIQVDENRFIQAFEDMGRDNHFSLPALRELFEFYDELDYDNHMELDVIAICCDWAEMDEETLLQEYGEEGEEVDDTINRIETETTVIRVEHWKKEDTFLVMSF